jgi:hypothetical protein
MSTLLLCTVLSSNHGFQFKIKALNMVVESKNPEIVSNQNYDLHQRFFFLGEFLHPDNEINKNPGQLIQKIFVKKNAFEVARFQGIDQLMLWTLLPNYIHVVI